MGFHLQDEMGQGGAGVRQVIAMQNEAGAEKLFYDIKREYSVSDWEIGVVKQISIPPFKIRVFHLQDCFVKDTLFDQISCVQKVKTDSLRPFSSSGSGAGVLRQLLTQTVSSLVLVQNPGQRVLNYGPLFSNVILFE